MGTRVYQVETARLQHAALLRCGRVVGQGRILAIGRDGCKALVEVSLHLAAEADEFVRGVYLGDALATLHGLLEPVEEAGLRHAILVVGTVESGDLGLVLESLLELHGRGGIDHGRAEALYHLLVEGIVEHAAINIYRCIDGP